MLCQPLSSLLMIPRRWPPCERSWQKHQLAYWTMAAYGSVYWLVAGGGKKEEK